MQLHVHEPEALTLEIKVELQAFAQLQPELESAAIGLPAQRMRLTGLNGLEHRDQPPVDRIPLGHLAGQRLLANRETPSSRRRFLPSPPGHVAGKTARP